MAFEVGKTYKGKITGIVKKCLWVSDTYVLLQCGYQPKPQLHPASFFDNHEEHHEPVVEKKRMYLAENKTSGECGIFASRVHLSGVFWNILGEIEFVKTDGKLTKLEIVDV